jgi:peptide-N4-(N-acetyl-beta-glucosaminyl)asparagine amidase
MRRKDTDKKERFDLMSEDAREDEEFRRNVIESLAYTISRILPGGDATRGTSQRSDPDAQKAAEARREAEMLRARGGHNTSNMPRGPGQ